MDSLYSIVMQFWQFWFDSSAAEIDASILQLLSVVTTIALVYGILIRPIVGLFRNRRK